MKQINLYSLIIALLTFTGCQPFYKIILGVRSPDFETKASIKKWENKLNLPDVPTFAYSFENWKTKNMLPLDELFVFDKSGNFISYKNPSNPGCPAPAKLFLAYLDSTTNYSISDQYHLNLITDSLKTLECETANYLPMKDANFHIFITFAKYSGKFNIKHNTLGWIKTLQENKNIRYELILINEDLQDCWSESQKNYFEKKK